MPAPRTGTARSRHFNLTARRPPALDSSRMNSLASSSAPTLLYAFPLLTAVVFSWIGWIYLAAARRRIPATAVYVYVGLVGTLVFAWRVMGTEWRAAPTAVWFWGVAAGLTQCLLIWGVKVALERGPMSPLWCSMNLAFVPVILVAAAAMNEPLSFAGLGAVATGIATVVLASARRASPTTPTMNERREPAASPLPSQSADPRARRWVYAALLVAVLASNSVMNIGIKVLGQATDKTGATWMDRFGPLFFFLLYTSILIPMGLAYGIHSPRAILSRRCGVLGVGAGFCSVAGLWMIGAAASLPAVYVFTVSCIVNILLTAAVSVVLFHERTDRLWVAMMTCAVVSVVLAGIGAA